MIAISKATLLGAAHELVMYETKSGKAMLKFKLKVWRQQGDYPDKVCFLPIVAYSSSAQVLFEHVTDGEIVYLDCQIDTFKDKFGDEQFQFIVEKFSFLGNKEVA